MNLTDILYFGLVFLIILAFFAILWLIGGYLLAWDVDRKYRTCPNCKRKGTGFIIETESELISSQINRDKLTPLRIQREKVTDQYQCEACQHTWTKTFEREETTPLGGISNS